MIKFFRKIRQRLLSENKFSKYLIYAIGEIFLVVIGILIALGINSKVAEYKNISKEKLHLKNVYLELQQIEKHIQKEDSFLKEKVIGSCNDLLYQIHLQKKIAPADSLNLMTFELMVLPNSKIAFKTYENLVNTNDLSIIRSNDIKSAFSEVNHAILHQTEMIDWQTEQWISLNQPYVFKRLEYLNITSTLFQQDFNVPESAFEDDWNQVLKDKEFRNLVFSRLLAAVDVTHSTERLLEKIELCKMLIKRELKEKHNEIL